MPDESMTLQHLVAKDPRYPIDAYMFVRQALAYAADTMELDLYEESESQIHSPFQASQERHLTGQQLCEAIRQFALNQFGYMAQIVLNSWGIDQTGCFGDIVYNMISVGIMKKSEHDQRSHFDNVYDFEEVFHDQFEFCDSFAQRRI